jgi:hypothetical protein
MNVLPQIDTPTYTVKLPISELTVKYRPYKVKEQKILSMAKESEEKNTLIEAILQVAQNCMIDPIDVRELPITDVEYFYYTLRARSESEIVELRYKCENVHEDKICGKIMDYDLNLLKELEVVKSDISPLIEITDKVGLKMRHSRFELDNIGERVPTPDEILEIIARNVEFIYDENSAYSAKDVPIANIINWIGELPPEKYIKIEEFLQHEPKIIKKLDITCSKCGFEHHIEVRDIFDFFI